MLYLSPPYMICWIIENNFVVKEKNVQYLHSNKLQMKSKELFVFL